MSPAVDPVVILGSVISTLAGEQTGSGSVMISEGTPGVEMITSADAVEVHPKELVTVKVNTPAGRSVMVLLEPVPVVVTPPGERVIVQFPAGNPLSTTLPVGTSNVGWVMVPTTGAEEVGGCAGITILSDGTDTHPYELVTV